MALKNTFTSGYRSVTDGDTTYEDPRDLTGEDNLVIANPEIQWQGVEDTTSNTVHDTNTNSDTATATTSTSTTTPTNSTLNSQTGDFVTVSAEADVPSGTGTAQSYEVRYYFFSANNNLSSDGEEEATVEYDTKDGTNATTTRSIQKTSGTPEGGRFQTLTGNGSPSPDFFRVTATNDTDHPDQTLEVGVEVDVTYEETTVNSQSTTVAYPSVPDTYNFDRHYYVEEKNSSTVDNAYIYSNNVGNTRTVTSNDPSNTWELTMRTRGEKTVQNTEISQFPSVSGDVSADYNSTLTENEESGWKSLSGFAIENNRFDHSVGGSDKVEYQIRFDWEQAIPTQVGTLKFYRNGTTHSVRLADPSDSALVYDSVRVHTDQLGTVAIDAVNTGNDDAAPITVSHPTHGTITFREIQ